MGCKWQKLAGLSGIALALLMGAARADCDKPVRFGVTDPLTGPSALFGKDQMQAVRWAVDDINAAGGVAGCKMEVTIVDNQGKPETAIAVVSRFIDVEHMPVFVTAFSDVVHAVAPIANRQKTLMLSAGANSPGIAHLGDYGLYRFTAGGQGDGRARPLCLRPGPAPRGDRLCQQRHRQGRRPGLQKFVRGRWRQNRAGRSLSGDQADFTGLILQLRVADPDEIHIHGVVADTTALLSQIRQLGITTPVDSYQNAFNPQMVKQVGPAANAWW